MIIRKAVEHVLDRANIRVNGADPWDIRVHDNRFFRRFAFGGSVALGDSYMEGWWDCDRPDMMIDRLLRSGVSEFPVRLDDIVLSIKYVLFNRHTKERSLRVARQHYDESPEFYLGVLGPTNSYTCARWDGVRTLDEAQVQKMDLLCRKAALKPGDHVLDIGCGYGGFLAHAATKYGTSGTGLSISKGQLAYARQRYGNLPIDFREMDYRDFEGEADAAVSICMIEHVGPDNLSRYFEVVRNALPEFGKFALQCILSHTKASMRDPWLDKHIFPGGVLLTYQGLRDAIVGKFHLIDQEFFGEDYVRTLQAWHANLCAQKKAVIAAYGEAFFRKYEYYFLCCAGAFMSKRIDVGQFVLCPTDVRTGYTPVRL